MMDVQYIRAVMIDVGTVGGEDVRAILADDPAIEIIGDYPAGAAAARAVRERKPDLLFLGMAGPQTVGLTLLSELNGDQMPFVVSLVAENHCTSGELPGLVECLIQPFDRERFQETLSHAKERVRRRREDEINRRLRALLTDAVAELQPQGRLMLKSGGRISFLRSEEIDWIEAQGDYVRIHSQGKKHLIREKISDLERELPSTKFLRIHRSTIVNVDRIREMQPLFYGEYAVVLQDGTRLTLSRSFRERVFQRLSLIV